MSNHQDESLQCYNCSFVFISCFVVAIRSTGYLQAFIAAEGPFLSEILHFLLCDGSMGKAKGSSEFSLNCWSSFLKMIQWLNFWEHFLKKILAHLLAWLWAGLQHKLQHFFFTLICVTSNNLQACPMQWPFAYFRGCGL